MDAIVLDVYFVQQATGETSISSLFDILNNPVLIYVFLIIFGVILLFFLIFFIMSKFKNPASYYERYKVIREEIAKVDDLYLKKKLSFEDYTFALFNYAKEYELIVSFLSKYPEYKPKLQSYTLKSVFPKENYTNTEEKKKQERIFFFADLLRPHIKYYSRTEIEQALLDEGFTRDIAILILNKLDTFNLKYGTESKAERNAVVNIINSLLSKQEKPELYKGTSSFDLSDLSKKKKNVFDNEPVTFEKYPVKAKIEEKKTFLSSITGIFKTKEKEHSVSEINDVFADIERRLKESN